MTCARIISIFEPLIDGLDVIYFEKKDTKAKGVCDFLLDPDLVCMLLLLSEVLAPINILSKFLQASTLFYCSVTEKVSHLLERLQDVKAEPKDHDSMETSLKFLSKAVSLLNVSAERSQLGRNLHSTMLAATHDPKDLVNTFLNSIGYGFVDDLIEEIKEQMLDDNPMLLAFNVFMPSNSSSLLKWNEQLQILCDHDGVALTDK